MGPICPDRFGHVRFTRFKFVNKRCTDVCCLQTLYSDLLPERAWWAHLSRLGLPASISRKKKHCTGERTQKIRNFWTVWAIESQKAAEDSQNKININYSRGFIMLQTQLAFRFPALEINKSFFIDRNKRDGKFWAQDEKHLSVNHSLLLIERNFHAIW